MAAPKWTPEERKRARERLAALEVNGPLDFGAARRAIEKDDAVDEARGALVAGKSLEEILAEKTPEQIEAIERVVKAGIAAQLDDEEGFGAFYEVVHKRRMPAHCKEWVKKIYEAHREGKGIVD